MFMFQSSHDRKLKNSDTSPSLDTVASAGLVLLTYEFYEISGGVCENKADCSS